MMLGGCRVLITGDLEPGFTVEGVVQNLGDLFDGSRQDLHGLFDGHGPYLINSDLSAEQALDLQVQLRQAGARARVERWSVAPLALKSHLGGAAIEQLNSATTPADAEPDKVAVPVDESVARPVKVEPAARKSGNRPAKEPAYKDLMEDWEVEVRADPEEGLGLFVGDNASHYLELFKEFQKDGRRRFRFSWSWFAFLFPFLWAMYRKIWGWSLLIFATSILLPVSLYVMGKLGIYSTQLVEAGYLVLVGNMLFWALVANYLYFRHASARVEQIGYDSTVDNVQAEIGAAGGASPLAALTGAILAAATLFTGVMILSVNESTDGQVSQPVKSQSRPAKSKTDDGEEETNPGDGLQGLMWQR